MSIRINIKGAKYDQLSCAQRAEIDQKRKKRLIQVRQQANEIAHNVRKKVQREKENQLSKFQKIKQQELNEWKKGRQFEIQQEYGKCLTNFGAAHIAACNASCEEDEVLQQKREEYDLMAAERGRSAMLQEQRKRDREAEERLAKRKRRQQKNAAVQADLVSRKEFGAHFSGVPVEYESEEHSEEEEAASARIFTSQPNLHKSVAATYNPRNFTSHSVDSSNNCDSEDSTSRDVDSEEEFNQITNMLKQKSRASQANFEGKIHISDSSDNEVTPRSLPKEKQTNSQAVDRKGILKKTQITTKKAKSEVKPTQPEENKPQRVKYVDFGNKYSTTYIPSNDLVTRNLPIATESAFSEAQIHERAGLGNISDGVLRQLAEIRSKEALEKENIRRDYERLRSELDEVSRQEQEAREAAGRTLRNISASQLNHQEESRKARMNQAVENTFKRNIITCPPVDSTASQRVTKEKSSGVNVAGPLKRTRSLSKNDSIIIVEQCNTHLKPNPKNEVENMVKIERLKDLLERINHQKKLLLREIEKSDDIPGQELEKVIKCLENLEKEKATLDTKPEDEESKKKIEELHAREQKLKEREKKLENGVRELYKTKKDLETAATNMPESETTSTSECANHISPVEIVIKVQSQSPRKSKHKKTIRCLDTLNRVPSKVYPRTPRKPKSSETTEARNPVPVKVQQQTQTTPSLYEAPKSVLKKITQVSPTEQAHTRKSDDSSVSTTYQSLPERINVAASTRDESTRKQHHKLNPVLMHYITRLLGMGKNIDSQLHVDVSSISTPGSSTINTSGNKSNVSDAQVLQFDEKRLEKLKEFINNNYSFLSEVNETLEQSQLQEQNEENIGKVDGVWNEVLRKKKISKQIKNDIRQKILQPPQPILKPKQPKLLNPPAQPEAPSILRPSIPIRKAQKEQLHLQPPQASTSQNQARQECPRTALTRPPITTNDMLNVTKYLESHMLNNFSEYTANCQQRISDLAQMMERVRQEKLKLIEVSLSSGELGHFTEYREIAISGKGQDHLMTSASDLKDSPSQPEDPPSEEINNILQKQTRPFGVSKDSGISLWSRPVTSSDFRDSPDVRVTSEEKENTFQPILKDISKPPRIKLTSPDIASTETLKDISHVIKDQEEKAQRKLKPPLSLNRFSPHLEKPHEPHELSTIAEIETPSASKLNLLEKVEENVEPGIESFLNFDEYTKNLQGQRESAPSFVTLGDANNILDEMTLKSFTAPKYYGIDEISKDSESQPASSSSSIVDIVEELKRRQIFNEPFNYGDEKEEEAQYEELRSPKKNANRILIKVPDNVEIKIQSSPSIKLTSADHSKQNDSPKSNDTLTGIQELEKEPKDGLDLQGMGLNWARSMLKRDVASQKLESSTSSSSNGKVKSIEIQTSTCDRSSSSSLSANSIGHPMNLREFLTRELKLKAKGDHSLSDESSLSSQFMRSLLKAASANSSSASRSSASDGERVRTSTPLQGRGNSTSHKSSNTQLFIGDSLSTLKESEKDSSERSDKSNKKD